MKKHSYGKLINMSWNWTVEMLFRPFSLKKWIMLGIIILLAGQMGANFNFNIGGKKGDLNKLIDTFKKKVSVTSMAPAYLLESSFGTEMSEGADVSQAMPPLPDIISKLSGFLKSPKVAGFMVLFILPLILLIGFVILLWIWVRANFSFVFIDSVIRNDASLKVPFHRNKPQGNSFFRWNLSYSIIVLLVFGAIISFPIMQLFKTGTFTSKIPLDVARILSVILPYVPLLIFAGILFILITLFVPDFVLPIMYKKKIGILKGWGVFLGLLRRNIGEIALYFLVKIGLAILALIFVILLTIIGVITLLVIGGLLALLGFFIYTATPYAAKGIVRIILILFGIPIYAFFGFLFNIFFIPIPIFFRIFSIYVLSSIDESLDFFVPKTAEEVMLEGSDERFKKSMALVWFAVLSPILVAIIAMILAITIPNFVKGKQWLLEKGRRGIDKILPIGEVEIPSIPDLFTETEPAGEPVTVYLKNGNIFEAEMISESENNVAFKINGGTIVYPRSDILRIEKKEGK